MAAAEQPPYLKIHFFMNMCRKDDGREFDYHGKVFVVGVLQGWLL